MGESFDQRRLLEIAGEAGVLTNYLANLSQRVRSRLPSTASPGDLREKSLYHLAITCHDLEIGFRLIAEHLVDPSWWRRFPNYADGTDAQLMANASHFQAFTVRGVFFSAVMITENYFRALHRLLVNRSAENSTIAWWQIRRDVLENLSMSSHIDIPLLAILFNVRNCIHNNGVFTQADTEVEWRNIRHRFSRGHPPNCVQPAFLLSAIRHLGDLMFEMSVAAAVLQLRDVENLYDRLGAKPTIDLP
ncbi:MAG: hypothetical protein HZA32_13155 [Opitutae bacterium]|nr:hypothetical protein [Opitutae bacterium]